MSIVPLERVTFAGLTAEKDRLLDDLHERGCLEIIPLNGDGQDSRSGGPSSQAREALKFLLTCPQRRHQVSDTSRFDAAAVEQRASELQRSIQALEAERDELLQRINEITPWGNFDFPAKQEFGALRLWFYIVPHKEMSKVEASHLGWEVVKRDSRFCYVVVVDRKEPTAMPVPRIHVGARSRDELAQHLEEVELAIEDVQAERAHLTRWCLLFARELTRLEDTAARAEATKQTCDRDQLFALQAWVPKENVNELAEYAAQQDFAFGSRAPTSEDQPPTLMRNEPRLAAGEDLVNFYMTPAYGTWDPSGIVLISFALFFAMILADAGYAAILGFGLLLFWRPLGRSEAGKRFRPLLTLIALFSLFYGVVVGSYFGVAPSQDSFLGRLHWLDMGNLNAMMGLSILVGGIHLVLANIMDARRHTDWRDGLASLGWASAVGGGLLIAAGATVPAMALLKPLGAVALVLGLALIVGFTAPHETPSKRLIYGLLGLTKISGAFGDILSYLRLFALGLASASLATAFNNMAHGIRSEMPRIGLLLAILVLVLGHALNLLLGVSSGVIHGLRLNVIEFFNWGFKDEGRRFTPFRRTETSSWT